MTIHIFNPEHDIALASNLSNFTAPHAGRQLRYDLGFLPALWAKDDDIVLVDDEEWAVKKWKRFRSRIVSALGNNCSLTGEQVFHALGTGVPKCGNKLGNAIRHTTDSRILPWGWNRALCAQLKRRGVPQEILPSDDVLNMIRNLSHRRVASEILSRLQFRGTIGESFECYQPEEVDALLQKYGHIIMKAPWSSSGRGLRFLSLDRSPLSLQMGWLSNVLKSQGSVMVEAFYHKVKDFGMEFYSDGNGSISYLGLSLFHTINGAYIGNILATESEKTKMITRYIPIDLLEDVKQQLSVLLGALLNGQYTGPFGVDMMIIAHGNQDGFLLHPCVEINLRRTMGHVALSLNPTVDDVHRVMRIEYINHNYKLNISNL